MICANSAKEKRLEEEAAYREARRKEREEQHLYLNARVVTEDTFKAHGGTDLTIFDQIHDVEPAAARSYRLLRKSTVYDLIDTVAKEINQDPKRMRMWLMVNRQNKTIRPDAPILVNEQTIEEVYMRMAGSKSQELRLWAEVADEVNDDGEGVFTPYHSVQNSIVAKTDLILLFLKYFDVEEQTLSGIKHIWISKEKKVEDLVPEILNAMGWTEKVQLKLFEVRSDRF